MPARLRWTLFVLCLAVLALATAQVLFHGPLLAMDQAISEALSRHRDPLAIQAMRVLGSVHRTVPVLAATALLAAWCGWRRDRGALRACLVVPVAMLANVGLKETIARPRPHWDAPLVHETTFSFPSGHAVAAAAFYGLVCALVFRFTPSRAWRAAAIALAALMVPLVACSRVGLGAHYPLDVVAGCAEGFAWALLFARSLQPSSSG